MNVRERFLTTMTDFGARVSPPKWEFGYWGENIENWYGEGLPRKRYPRLPRKTSTPNSSLYLPCWKSIHTGRLSTGLAVIGGGLYWPTQSFPIDNDVRTELGMDLGQILVNVNLLFHPMFEVRVIEETEETMTYVDIDGVKRLFIKKTGVIPSALENPIRDWASWNRLKEERLNLKDVRGRFPANWNELLSRYRNRDFPLVLGGYPQGYFGTLAHLMGYEKLFYNYADDPDLIHDIQKTFTDIWLAVYAEVLAQTSVDLFVFWEDISAGSGSMVSPAMIREFMVPYYKRVTAFLKERGVKVIFVDTDGECTDLVPLFLDGGLTGMYPMEASCGVDIVKVRKLYPRLQLMGGIAKSQFSKGRAAIDKALTPAEAVLATGGYVPFGDHLIPPEVHWDDFRYYREKLNGLIDRRGR
jgi:uroporphyrinogen decarboxylase